MTPIDVVALDDDRVARRGAPTVQSRAIGARLWLAPAGRRRRAEARSGAVRIHMGLAFGTGEHPTTALCLEWLERARRKAQTVLDYGCGSGVLAIAALALGARHALAVDNDPQAIAATNDERAPERRGRAACSSSRRKRCRRSSSDVLVANILAAPLVAAGAGVRASLRAGRRARAVGNSRTPSRAGRGGVRAVLRRLSRKLRATAGHASTASGGKRVNRENR